MLEPVCVWGKELELRRKEKKEKIKSLKRHQFFVFEVGKKYKCCDHHLKCDQERGTDWLWRPGQRQTPKSEWRFCWLHAHMDRLVPWRRQIKQSKKNLGKEKNYYSWLSKVRPWLRRWDACMQRDKIFEKKEKPFRVKFLAACVRTYVRRRKLAVRQSAYIRLWYYIRAYVRPSVYVWLCHANWTYLASTSCHATKLVEWIGYYGIV